MIRKIVKQGLLYWGGYNIARRLYNHHQHHKLKKKVDTLLETGNAPLPDEIMFEPTQQCNLRCKMCYQDRKALTQKKELIYGQIVRLFDENPFFRKVTLYGGEIFMRKDIMDIIRYLNTSKNLILPTNGTLIKEPHIEALRRFKNISTMCISLDGPKKIHDSIRGVKGSYDKAFNTIRSLVKILPITVTCVLQNDNIDVIPDMVDICAEIGVKKLKIELERLYAGDQISSLLNGGDTENETSGILYKGRTRDYSLSYMEKMLEQAEKRAIEKKVYLTYDPWCLKKEAESCYQGSLRAKSKQICTSFRMATIAPNGDVIHCYALRKAFGNILERPFKEIWESNHANEFKKKLIESNLTPFCENCGFLLPLDHRFYH